MSLVGTYPWMAPEVSLTILIYFMILILMLINLIIVILLYVCLWYLS